MLVYINNGTLSTIVHNTSGNCPYFEAKASVPGASDKLGD